MQFLFPVFLWSLVALAIPVIIHLFYFRRFKKVQFTNVRLLKEIKEETSSRNKLKDLIILISRLLALIFLILAFAQPFLPQGDTVKSGRNIVSVYIDNSFSMSAEKNQTPLIDIAKEKASQIVQAYGTNDLFQVITNDFEGKHQRLISQDDALAYIEEIEISPGVRLLSQVIQRQKQMMDYEDANNIVYHLSDFQSNMFDENPIKDSLIEINLIPLRAALENNVAIDSVWLESGVAYAGQNNKLVVKLHNYGNDRAESVRLAIVRDGQEKPEGIKSIPAGESLLDTIMLSIVQPGWHTAELKISDYPIQFDDQYFISFYVDESLNVLTIHDSQVNRFLQALFRGIDRFNFNHTHVSAINYGEINLYDLIIIQDIRNYSTGLVNALNEYIISGGKVLVFPGIDTEIAGLNRFLSALNAYNLDRSVVENDMQVTEINTHEFVFKDVFDNQNRNLTLPTVSHYFTAQATSRQSSETLLGMRNGQPYLQKFQRGNGILYLSLSPIDEKFNNLVHHAEIFVPMIYKMAIAKAHSEPLAYTIGNADPITVKKSTQGSEMIYKIKGLHEFIPSQTGYGNQVIISENAQIRQAGIYDLTLNNELIMKLAFNYDRRESDMSLVPLEELKSSGNIMEAGIQTNLTLLITQKDKGIILWRWCLILALIFILAESVLLRFLKK